MTPIQYRITPQDLVGHRFIVELTINTPHPEGQRVQLPAWIPGSYLIRDFSKQIENIEAFYTNNQGKKIPLALTKVDSSTWDIAPSDQGVTVKLTAYAFDTSVRTAYLDQERGFFNASSLCLKVSGQEALPCEISLISTSETQDWEIQTSLPKLKVDKNGFGTYLVSSYDELIDHPVALGQFTKIKWLSYGIPHRMVIQGSLESVDRALLERDLKILCETHIAFFDQKKKRAPFKEYVFLVNAVGNGYGGLEHRSSTALLCSRSDLPYPQAKSPVAGNSQELPNQAAYENFLGLCSHEYFHAWMIKKVQPKAFQPYELDRKNFTRLLWLFEGFTSYYDDLQLFRSKRISKEKYLQRVLDNWNGVLRNPGRHKQSVADSSFDAWTKYYQADENTPNAVVSYYAKGALVALGLDLLIRDFSHNHHSLDDIMHEIWKRHGAFGTHPGLGISEHGFGEIVIDVMGKSFTKPWKNFAKRYIDGKEDLPLEELLQQQGLTLKEKISPKKEALKAILGIRTVSSDGWVKITHVLDGGTAQKSGLAPGDLIASLNQERVTPARWDGLLDQVQQNALKMTIFRHDAQLEISLSTKGGQARQFELNPLKS